MDEITDDLKRIPGLYRRWELAQLLQSDADYHLADAGKTTDGTRLIAVYERLQPKPDEARHG